MTKCRAGFATDLQRAVDHFPLLPILGKVLEHGVCFRLYNHVKHQITKYQHGFLRQRSCVTQLLFLLHDIGKSLDKNIQTDIIYLDFAKAFDRLCRP